MPSQFDPFNNRLCRDIRNGLSEGFMKALIQRSTKPADESATPFFKMELPPVCEKYINHRLQKYHKIIFELIQKETEDTFLIASLIWNQELFFEVHDYLELHWMKASGDDKIILQALIRAAGTYVHLEQGKSKGARGMADKALMALSIYKDVIPSPFNPDLLITKLRSLDTDPPKFHASAQ